MYVSDNHILNCNLDFCFKFSYLRNRRHLKVSCSRLILLFYSIVRVHAFYLNLKVSNSIYIMFEMI